MIPMLRKILRPWRLLSIVLIVLIVLGVVDWQLKKTAFDGYYPESTSCLLVTEDFGGFYASLPQTDAIARLSKELSFTVSDFEMSVRKQIGVRPTPFRWRVWLGNLLVVARSNDGIGICLKPGLLVRTAERLHRMKNSSNDAADGVYSVGAIFYGWRDGFLILSQQRQYVAACLQSTAAKLAPQSIGRHIRIRVFNPEPTAELTVAPENGLPITGWMNARITARTAPLTLAEAWPAQPLISITASTWDDVRSMSGAVHSLAEKSLSMDMGFIDNILLYAKGSFPFEEAPIAWDAGTDECSCALMGIDANGFPPLPEVGLVLRSTTAAEGQHPLTWLASQQQAIQYEWKGRPGLMLPWMGEQLSLCLSSYDSDWLLTSKEPLMNTVLGNLKQETEVDADAAVKVDWFALAGSTLTVVRQTAQFGLIPGLNEDKVNTQLTPITRAIGILGLLDLQAYAGDKGLTFSGHLAQQASASN